MSEENVEIVRRIYEAVADRDTATVLALYDPDVEWDFTRGGLGGIVGQDIYHGHEGLRSWFREWYDAWENVEDLLNRLIDVGEHVISVSAMRARGRASGVDIVVDNQVAVWSFANGKVVRVVWFGSPGGKVTGAKDQPV